MVGCHLYGTKDRHIQDDPECIKLGSWQCVRNISWGNYLKMYDHEKAWAGDNSPLWGKNPDENELGKMRNFSPKANLSNTNWDFKSSGPRR